MSSVRSNNISLKYQRFTTLGFKDIRIKNRVCGKGSTPFYSLKNVNVIVSKMRVLGKKQESTPSLFRVKNLKGHRYSVTNNKIIIHRLPNYI